jgi:hypothetical protein
MENKINETENDNATIVKEIIERIKGKNYATIMSILRSVKDSVEIHLTLN